METSLDEIAAEKGHLHILIWLDSIGTQLSEDIICSIRPKTCTLEMLSSKGIALDDCIFDKNYKDDVIDWVELNCRALIIDSNYITRLH